MRHLYRVTHALDHVSRGGVTTCLTCHRDDDACLYSDILLSPSNNAYIQVILNVIQNLISLTRLSELSWSWGSLFACQISRGQFSADGARHKYKVNFWRPPWLKHSNRLDCNPVNYGDQASKAPSLFRLVHASRDTALPHNNFTSLLLPREEAAMLDTSRDSGSPAGAPRAHLHIMLPPGHRDEDKIAFPTIVTL